MRRVAHSGPLRATCSSSARGLPASHSYGATAGRSNNIGGELAVLAMFQGPLRYPQAAQLGRSRAWRSLVDGPSQRPTVVVPNSIVTEHEVADAGVLGQVQRDRMVGAERPAGALQGVLAQGAGRLRLPLD